MIEIKVYSGTIKGLHQPNNNDIVVAYIKVDNVAGIPIKETPTKALPTYVLELQSTASKVFEEGNKVEVVMRKR